MRLLFVFVFITSRLLFTSPIPHLSEEHELCRSGTGPILVNVGLEIISIPEINEPEEKFKLHGILHLKWNDILNRFDPEVTGCDPVVFEESAAAEALSSIWWPDPDFKDAIHRPELSNQMLTVFSNGDCHLQMLIQADIRYYPDLYRFPFDSQNLSVIIEPFGFNSDEVVFIVDSAYTDINKKPLPVDWVFDSIKYEEKQIYEFHHSYKTSQINFSIITKRKGNFYIWRLLIPMILIVMVTWTVFWMVGEKLNDRIKVIAIGLLSAVSFAHFLGNQMPEIPYLSFLDTVFISSLIIVFVSVIESLFSYSYFKKNKIEKAHLLDKSFRFIMPVLYFLVLYIIYEYYF